MSAIILIQEPHNNSFHIVFCFVAADDHLLGVNNQLSLDIYLSVENCSAITLFLLLMISLITAPRTLLDTNSLRLDLMGLIKQIFHQSATFYQYPYS